MKDIVLQPTFYDKFSCLGSDCKNNCCTDWTKMNLEILKEKCTLKNLKIYFKTLLNLKKVKMIDAQLNLMKIKSVSF